MGKIKSITADVYVGDYGQMADSFEIILEGELAGEVKMEDFSIDNHFMDLTGKTLAAGITGVLAENKSGETRIKVEVAPFVYRYDFRVMGKAGDGQISFGRDDITETKVKDLEKFCAYTENGVNYRLYEPDAAGPRPLVLFLHGGGECGEDNLAQMTGTIGALKLAERWPDMYIMAPQAPSGGMGMFEVFEIMKKRGNPFRVEMGMTPFSLKGERGWNRDYLGKVCDIIRKMTAHGKVDPGRVYVIGMSMGGGGVLNVLSVAPSLFASAVAVCPSMNGESYGELLHLPMVPLWIATAYMDHQPGRHAYLLEACEKLWKEGRRDVEYTIFKPEELEAYGIGTTEHLTSKELYEENHNSWILVFHNERGILDWMISHQK